MQADTLAINKLISGGSFTYEGFKCLYHVKKSPGVIPVALHQDGKLIDTHICFFCPEFLLIVIGSKGKSYCLYQMMFYNKMQFIQ